MKQIIKGYCTAKHRGRFELWMPKGSRILHMQGWRVYVLQDTTEDELQARQFIMCEAGPEGDALHIREEPGQFIGAVVLEGRGKPLAFLFEVTWLKA